MKRSDMVCKNCVMAEVSGAISGMVICTLHPRKLGYPVTDVLPISHCGHGVWREMIDNGDIETIPWGRWERE